MELFDKSTVILNALIYLLTAISLAYPFWRLLPIDTYKKKWKATSLTLIIGVCLFSTFLYFRWYILDFDYNHTENIYWNIKDIVVAIIFLITAFINFKR